MTFFVLLPAYSNGVKNLERELQSEIKLLAVSESCDLVFFVSLTG